MNTVRQIALSIVTELTEHPEHWCQDGIAFSKEIELVSPNDSQAVQWCLLGHVAKRAIGSPLEQQYKDALYSMLDPGQSIGEWNDAPERTVQDVISLCERIAQHE